MELALTSRDLVPTSFDKTPNLKVLNFKISHSAFVHNKPHSLFTMFDFNGDTDILKSITILIHDSALLEMPVIYSQSVEARESEFWSLRLIHNGNTQEAIRYAENLNFSGLEFNATTSVIVDINNNVVMAYNKGIARKLVQASHLLIPEIIDKGILPQGYRFAFYRCGKCSSIIEGKPPYHIGQEIVCEGCGSVSRITYNGWSELK